MAEEHIATGIFKISRSGSTTAYQVVLSFTPKVEYHEKIN